MIKTGAQFFETNILGKINSEVKIAEIVLSSPTRWVVRLCELKWLRTPGLLLTDSNEGWLVNSINTVNNTVELTPPNDTAVLIAQQVVNIDLPVLKVGTQLNLNAEQTHKMNTVGSPLEPLFVWLVETIKGKRLLKEENGGAQYEFVFCVLFTLNSPIEDTFNNQRHFDGVVQATQLVDELTRVMDESNGITRETAVDFIEYNLFGRETKQGIEKYILDANLSGIECRVTVRATRKMCNCEC